MSEEDQTYNPRDVSEYFGKFFITKSGSRYGFTEEGKFTGRKSIEGAEIMLVAGINNDYYSKIVDCLDTSKPELKEKLDNLILEHGEEIKPGLMLVVSLTPEYVKEKNRHGLITSPIVDIE